MRFLVISYGIEPLDFSVVRDAALRSHRYREELIASGKLIEHAHIAGQRGHAWIYEVESVDELDQVISDDAMTAFSQNDPTIFPICSYSRMADRERELLQVHANDQADMAKLEREGRDGSNGMRFLVVAFGRASTDPSVIGDAPQRANRYREDLLRTGVISLHGHLAGQRGHMWVYRVESVDELDRVMSADPMAQFHQVDPLILPLCSYERMHEREEQFFATTKAPE